MNYLTKLFSLSSMLIHLSINLKVHCLEIPEVYCGALGTMGICLPESECDNSNWLWGNDTYGNCGGVYFHSTKAKPEKIRVCCVNPSHLRGNGNGTLDPNAPCGLLDGDLCGPIGRYAQSNSLCCGAGEGVITCDGPRVTLTHTLCNKPYSCVERFGIHWKRDEGDEGGDEAWDVYAQCELAH
jgi:hypothetical protein